MIQMEIRWDGIDRLAHGFDAAAETFRRPGVGVSYYKARKKLPGEKVRPARAWLILNTIKQARGRDPLEPPAELEREIQDMLSTEVLESIDVAFATNRPQKARIRAALLGGARDMREDAQERIRNGSTGYANTSKYARTKNYMLTLPPDKRSPRFRNATREFGAGRPLVVTGRLYHCMQERWYEMAPRRIG